MPIQIHVKNAGTEADLVKIARWWEAHFPEKFALWVRDMTKLKTVSRAGYGDAQGRYTQVKMKVPTELFLSIQHCLPGFGDDSDDIALLTKVLSKLNGSKEYRKKTSIWVPDEKGTE